MELFRINIINFDDMLSNLQLEKEISGLQRDLRRLLRNEKSIDEEDIRKKMLEIKIGEAKLRFAELNDGKEYVPNTVSLARSFCEDLFYTLDCVALRVPDEIKNYYQDNASLVIQGGPCANDGLPAIITTFSSMYENLRTCHEIVAFSVDSNPTPRYDISISCKTKLKIDNDNPRVVLQIFEVRTNPDYDMKVLPAYRARRHLMINCDSRPLYCWPERSNLLKRREFHDNWDPSRDKPKEIAEWQELRQKKLEEPSVQLVESPENDETKEKDDDENNDEDDDVTVPTLGGSTQSGSKIPS